jgi:hypothetical protein
MLKWELSGNIRVLEFMGLNYLEKIMLSSTSALNQKDFSEKRQ